MAPPPRVQKSCTPSPDRGAFGVSPRSTLLETTVLLFYVLHIVRNHSPETLSLTPTPLPGMTEPPDFARASHELSSFDQSYGVNHGEKTIFAVSASVLFLLFSDGPFPCKSFCLCRLLDCVTLMWYTGHVGFSFLLAPRPFSSASLVSLTNVFSPPFLGCGMSLAGFSP